MKIIVIHGPNLNLLGKREVAIYGTLSLDDINAMIQSRASDLGMDIVFHQFNHEGEIVNSVQQSKGVYTHLIMNPGAYSHTSIAIRDAITGVGAKVYEVHISNIYEREKFRHFSYITDVAQADFVGMGIDGYIAAINAISEE